MGDRAACPVTEGPVTNEPKPESNQRKKSRPDPASGPVALTPRRSGRLSRIVPDSRPLRIPAFRRMFLSQIATVVGSQLTAVAVQQQIFDVTGSSALVGLASLVALVPLVVFGLLGGAVADSFDRRKLMMITSVGIAGTSLALWLTALSGTRQIWVVMAFLALQQGFFAVNQPTRSAILPRIVPAELVPSANALNLTVFSTGVIVGPLLVGVLIPLTGLPWLFFIDALTLTGVLYAVIRLPPIPPAGAGRGRAKVSDGLIYLKARPLLLMTFVVDIIAMVCGMPRALFPAMAEHTFGGPPGGGVALGVLNAGLAVGSLLGGLTGGWITRVHRQGIAILLAVVMWGLSMALFGTTSVLMLAVIYLAVGGFSDLVSSVYRSTLLQVAATDEMRGRMQGVFTVVVVGGPRLADLVHGVVADATSTAFAVIGGGLLCVVLTVIAGWFGRSLRDYDSRNPTHAEPGRVIEHST